MNNVNCQNKTGNVEKSLEKTENDKGSSFVGQRHLVVLWGFLFTALMNVHRTTMSVALVAMVNHTQMNEIETGNISSISSVSKSASQSAPIYKIDGEFNWNPQLQGNILGVSFFSYVLCSFFAGRIAEILTAKRVLLYGNFFTALFTIVAPFTARWNIYALLADQFARGFAQGFILTPLFVAMANWFPRKERGMLSSFVMSGLTVGCFIGGVFSGWLCDIPQLGWSSAFYIVGGFHVLLCAPFAYFYYEKPQDHPYISKEELKYIICDQENDMTQKRPPVPWKKILTSIKVHAAIVGLFGFNWQFVQFFVVHPTYMGVILHFSMTGNGLASSFPFLAMTFGTFVSGSINGWITKRGILSVDKLRKGCSTICAFGYSICVVGVILAEHDKMISVICSTTALFFCGIAITGVPIVGGDMSPTFSGSLNGLMYSTSNIASMLLPIVVGNMTKKETLEEWHRVFYLDIGIAISCALIFHILGSAEVQSWNSPDSIENKSQSVA